MDKWHGDEPELSANDARRSAQNEDDAYERWIFSRYTIHEIAVPNEFNKFFADNLEILLA